MDFLFNVKGLRLGLLLPPHVSSLIGKEKKDISFSWKNIITGKKESFYKISFFWKKERKWFGLGGMVSVKKCLLLLDCFVLCV